MGLANKLGTGGAGPSAPSAPPLQGNGFQGAGQPGAPPPGYPQFGGPQTQGRPSQASPYGSASAQTSPYGSSQPGQYGAPGSAGAPGQYGTPSSQGNQFYPQMGGTVRPQQQGMPGQYGAQQGQYGSQQPAQYGSQQQPGQYGSQQQQPGQYGSQQQPGQYGAPGSSQQFGQPGQAFGQQQGQQSQYGQPQGQQFGAQQGFGGPQGQYGARPAGQQAFGGGAFSQPMVLQKLQKLVADNRLQAFYPPQKLEQVANFVAGRDVEGLGQRWRLPREVTMDLVGLALYDICIYVDDSGSMAFEEGGERIDDMKAVLGRTADAATLFDTDGIVVRFMNCNVEGNGIHSEAEAAALVQQIRFSGTTPLGTSLDRKVLQPMVLSQARSNSMQKPVLVICITDGEPTGEPKDTVRQVVINAKNQLSNTQYGAGAVAFQFAQVGKDVAATRFLSALDTDPVCGNMIDSTSYFEQEQEQYARKGINLEPSLYLAKLMLGGIDRTYDEADEG